MIAVKQLWNDFKLFLRIFAVIFVILLIIFNSAAFTSILPYKISRLFGAAKEIITSQPRLGNFTNTPAPNIQDKIVVSPAVPPEAIGNNILELPKFGIKAPIWKIDNTDLKLIYKKLREGVVLYPGSAIPGQGYSIIIGHSSQYPWQPGRYKSVFSLLNELKTGDKIYVYWNGRPLVFQVEDKKIFLPLPKGGETTETIFPPEDKPILILQSCWPVGVAYKRVAVKTILISE